MDKAKLHPEIRKAVSQTPRLPFGFRPLLPLCRALYNIAARTPLSPDVSVSRESHDGLDILVYQSKAKMSDGAILWMFGGGHWAGKPEHLNAMAARAAREVGVPVFVPNYRLAPRHPFPANLDDCHKAWTWLIQNARGLGIDGEQIVLAGNSAGGGLAAALAQRLCDEGGVQPAAQCLFYPMFDDRTAADRSLDAINHFIWNNEANFAAWSAYLGSLEPGASALPPYAAPARRESLAGLAPSWIGMCTLDLFYEENEDYARRLHAEGVPCEICRVDGVPHAFEVIQPQASIAEAFQQSALAFLKKALSVDAP
ncbi:MAG: alpha/beta hydrolase [Pseudomonadota bacterium]